nr:MAG TPA: hypothetical protein [Caudoviricetes sp.]
MNIYFGYHRTIRFRYCQCRKVKHSPKQIIFLISKTDSILR